MPERKKQSVFNLIGLPDAFGVVILTFALILAIIPFMPDADFGIFKVPSLDKNIEAALRKFGIIFFCLIVALFIPFKQVSRKSSKPSSASSTGQPVQSKREVQSQKEETEGDDLLIKLDENWDFSGNEEGAKTIAYRILKRHDNQQKVSIKFSSEAYKQAVSLREELGKINFRSEAQEKEYRQAIKVIDHSIESSDVYERSIRFVLSSAYLMKELSLGTEESFSQVLLGLRDAIFNFYPVLLSRINTPVPGWLNEVSQRTEQCFIWFEEWPDHKFIVIKLRPEEKSFLERYIEAGYRRLNNMKADDLLLFEPSDSCGCHVFGLPLETVQRVVAPKIVINLIKEGSDAATAEKLVEITRWIVASSKPKETGFIFTWEQHSSSLKW